MSNLTHKEHKVYEAHTAKQTGYQPYISLDNFSKFKNALLKIANENLDQDELRALAVVTLKDVLGDSL